MKRSDNRNRWLRRLYAAGAAGLLLAAFSLTARAASGWNVLSYYGTYDVKTKKPGQPATSLIGPKAETWKTPTPAKPYVIGVSFPHLKDPYWLAVDYGVIDEARKLGVGIELVAAGGYTEITQQINQVENLANQKVNGIILAAISYSGEDQLVAGIVDRGIPVIEVINDIQAPKIRAKALVSFYDMGYKAGVYVAEQARNSAKPVNVVFLPGPAGSGWAPDTLDGFKAATAKLAPDKVKILDVKWGDTGKNVQLQLIENVLATYPQLDYLVGNAVASDAAPGALETAGRAGKVKVVSTYITPPLYQDIAKGKVAAAPTDFTALQGRMAVDMMVEILNGKVPGKDMPFRSGPVIQVVTPSNYRTFSYDAMFGPRSWRPVFSVKARE
jgi:protein TorT